MSMIGRAVMKDSWCCGHGEARRPADGINADAARGQQDILNNMLSERRAFRRPNWRMLTFHDSIFCNALATAIDLMRAERRRNARAGEGLAWPRAQA
jgi:hypothetical protein